MDGYLERLLRRLMTHQVEAVLVEGYAAAAWGGTLVTQDIDVACRMTPENLERVYEALADLNPMHRMAGPGKARPFTKDEIGQGWRNLYLKTDWGQLDCLGTIEGIGDFDACLAESEKLDLDGYCVSILSLDALISAKKALNRPRDIHAVHELEAIREMRRPPL